MVERRVGSHQNNFFQSLRISVIQEAGDLDLSDQWKYDLVLRLVAALHKLQPY